MKSIYENNNITCCNFYCSRTNPLSAPSLQAAALYFDDGIRTTATFTYNNNTSTHQRSLVDDLYLMLSIMVYFLQVNQKQSINAMVLSLMELVFKLRQVAIAVSLCISDIDPVCINTEENPTIDNPWLF